MAVSEVDILSPRLTDDRVTLTLPATGRQTTVHRDGLGEAPGGQAVWAEAWGHRLMIRTGESRVREQAWVPGSGGRCYRKSLRCPPASRAGGPEARMSRSGWIYSGKSRPGAIILGLERMVKVDPGQRK